MSYYDRETTRYSDGSPRSETAEDRKNEREVARRVEEAWACRLVRYPQRCPIDWYAERHDNLIGLCEVKCRPHPAGKYPTVFLNIRKYLSLLLGWGTLGVPGIFIVGFKDALKWIDVATVTPGTVRIQGCKKRVKSSTDIEPIIDVPIGEMKDINTKGERP